MVHVIVRLTSQPGRSHALIEALHMLMQRSLQTSGCSNAHLAADIDEADVFWYSEDWLDVGALEARLRGEHFLQLLALIETSVSPPLLEFRMVEERRGLEYVAAVRGADAGTLTRSEES
jgi:quinol monooxygenase YgiN